MKNDFFLKFMLVVIAALLALNVWIRRDGALVVHAHGPYHVFYIPASPNSASLLSQRLAQESRKLVGFAADPSGGLIGILQ